MYRDTEIQCYTDDTVLLFQLVFVSVSLTCTCLSLYLHIVLIVCVLCLFIDRFIFSCEYSVCVNNGIKFIWFSGGPRRPNWIHESHHLCSFFEFIAWSVFINFKITRNVVIPVFFFFLEKATTLGIDTSNITRKVWGRRQPTTLSANDVSKWYDDSFVTTCSLCGTEVVWVWKNSTLNLFLCEPCKNKTPEEDIFPRHLFFLMHRSLFFQMIPT